jgi:hypothetical protein
MSGASTEETLELWAASLREAKARMRPLFTQERVAASAGLFLDGLLGEERRQTGWMRAEAAGDPGPWRRQAILGRGRWDAEALRDIVREYVVEHLADEDAVLVIDETGFLKQEGVLRRGSAIHGLVGLQPPGSTRWGEDHQLPDRRIRGLCLAARSCLYRSGAIPAEGVDQRSSPDGGRSCAAGHRLCRQAGLGAGAGRSRHRGGGAVCLGRG